MEKKKVSKIIFIVIFVIISLIVVAALVHLIRNFIIINKIAKSNDELTNFTLTVKMTQHNEQDDTYKSNIIERYYKDGAETIVLKNEDESVYTIYWHDKDSNEQLSVIPRKMHYSVSEVSDMAVRFEPFLKNDFKSKLALTLGSIITTEELDGKKCYVVSNSLKEYFSADDRKRVKI